MRSLRPAVVLGSLLLLGGCSDGLQLLSVTAITPQTIVAGAAPTLITVTGTQFNRNMSITFGGIGQPTTFVSPTTLTTMLPGNTAVGTYPIAIYDNEGGLAGAATLPTSFTLQVTAK